MYLIDLCHLVWGVFLINYPWISMRMVCDTNDLLEISGSTTQCINEQEQGSIFNHLSTVCKTYALLEISGSTIQYVYEQEQGKIPPVLSRPSQTFTL